MKILPVVLCWIFLWGSLAQSLDATDPTNLGRYTELKSELVRKEEEKRKLLAELYRTTHQLKIFAFRKERLDAERIDIQRRVKESARSVARLDDVLQERRSLLRRRLLSFYKNDRDYALKVLFSSRSMEELEQSLRVVRLLSERDARLVISYTRDRRKYQAERRKLISEIRRMKLVEKELNKEGLAFQAEQGRQKTLLSSLETKRLLTYRELKNIKESSSNFGSSDPSKNGFSDAKGSLAAPVKGTLAQSFGSARLDDSFTMRMKGQVFRTDVASPIHSVFDGIVAFVGPVVGHGWTVVIDHGEHYYSVYSLAGKTTVRQGDRVRRGDQIADTGPKSPRYGTGLYFEIRHFSDPLDPTEWLSSSKTQTAAMH